MQAAARQQQEQQHQLLLLLQQQKQREEQQSLAQQQQQQRSQVSRPMCPMKRTFFSDHCRSVLFWCSHYTDTDLMALCFGHL